MKKIPDGAVDAVITDPPYGEHQTVWDSEKPPVSLWDDMYRLLCVGGVAYYFGFWGHADWVLENAKRVGFDPLSRIVWWFQTGRPEKFAYREDTEEAWYLAKGTPLIFNANAALEPYGDSANYRRYDRDGKHPGTVWVASRILHNHPENCGHETQKPLEIIEKMVAVSSDGNSTILDPFCGSGTTLVAAKKLGRHFLGFELDENYCRISRERLAAVDAQPSLFEAKPEQLSL